MSVLNKRAEVASRDNFAVLGRAHSWTHYTRKGSQPRLRPCPFSVTGEGNPREGRRDQATTTTTKKKVAPPASSSSTTKSTLNPAANPFVSRLSPQLSHSNTDNQMLMMMPSSTNEQCSNVPPTVDSTNYSDGSQSKDKNDVGNTRADIVHQPEDTQQQQQQDSLMGLDEDDSLLPTASRPPPPPQVVSSHPPPSSETSTANSEDAAVPSPISNTICISNDGVNISDDISFR